MGIPCPLDTSNWELVDEPKDIVKPSSFPSSGAVLVLECDDLKEFKRYLFDSGRTCNEAVGNPKYLSWNGTSFWYPTTGTGKTIYKWNQLKHFIPVSKDVPEYVRCIEVPDGWSSITKKYTIYKTDKYPDGGYRILYHDVGGGQTTEGNEHCFVSATKQEYDAQFSNDVSMFAVQEECKRRFPIGCTYKENDFGNEITLLKDEDTYSIHGNRIYAHAGGGLLYHNGIYATLAVDKQDPLYICKQEYRKGMRVRSAAKTGIFSGEFIIDVEPKEFRNLSGKTNVVDYTFSKGYLYFNGEYAEILEEGVYDVSEIIKTNKPSIEFVQSVDVNLRTKKQINKFKF
jgi:hypothetical protein